MTAAHLESRWRGSRRSGARQRRSRARADLGRSLKRSAFTALTATVVVVLSLGIFAAPAGALGDTTTTLTGIAPSTVNYGSETSVVFSASVNDPLAIGTISIYEESSMTPLCTITSLVTGAGSCSPSSDTVLNASPTAYSIIAVYSGGGLDNGSTSSPSDLTVDQEPTTTSLGLSSNMASYGQESTLIFTSSVSPQPTGTPLGTIEVDAGTTALCTIPLPASTCSTTDDDALSAASYEVTATYSGNTDFASSPSDTSSLTVNQANSSTSLVISAGSVAFGDETSIQFQVTVGAAGGAPTGTVSVATTGAGATPLCAFTLTSADNGQDSCNPTTDTLLAISATPYLVVATYAGDGSNVSGSSSSPAQDLTVVAASTTTTLTPLSSSATSGDESALLFNVTVSSHTSLTPTGTVTVATTGAGATPLCSFDLTSSDNGQGSCNPTPATVLAAANSPYAVTASFVSSGDLASSTSSPPSSLTVDKDPTSTSLSAAPSSVTYASGSEEVTFTASVAPTFAGTPTGTVTVAIGGTTLCSFDPTTETSCPANLAAFGAGAYTVTATYPGDTNFESSSGTHGFTVNQAAPNAPNITNLPAGAAEEGSFTADVATNGDGARSVVSDTPGNCTVGSDGLTVKFDVAGQCTLTPHVASGHDYTGASGGPQTFTIATGPRGYWLVGSDGGIFSFGAAQFYGSMGGTTLQRPVVGITPTTSKSGYWLVASDGGIFAFGDAGFFGSIPGLGLHPAGSGLPHSLDAPIVGMVPSRDGGGYFMVASDGGVFAFGDAKFAGSCPGIGGCAGTAVAVMPDASGNGYWLVTSDGAVYAFGDAPFFGAPAPQSSPVVNAVATPDGGGYWVLYANGAVLSFGDAGPYGGPLGYVNQFNPATSIFPTTDGLGYWVASAKGDVFTFGNAPFLGGMAATHLNGPIIAAFGF